MKCPKCSSKHIVEQYRELQPENYPKSIKYHCYDCGIDFTKLEASKNE